MTMQFWTHTFSLPALPGNPSAPRESLCLSGLRKTQTRLSFSLLLLRVAACQGERAGRGHLTFPSQPEGCVFPFLLRHPSPGSHWLSSRKLGCLILTHTSPLTSFTACLLEWSCKMTLPPWPISAQSPEWIQLLLARPLRLLYWLWST